mgnify:CR=1 FL=1
MSFQDVVIALLGLGLVATWVLGARMIRRMATELDEFARDRVEHDELQTSVGRTLGQLQLAADNLADALATRTERLHELLAQADAQSATLGEAIAVAATLTERLAVEGAALRQVAASGRAVEAMSSGTAESVVRTGDVAGAYANGSTNGVSYASNPMRDESRWSPSTDAGVVRYDQPVVNAPVRRDDVEAEAVTAPASADEVRRLARDGMDLASIARRTNRGREEVRLLLRFAGTPDSVGGRRATNSFSGEATLMPGTFRRP